jgi:Raf kinase inhibitor-like YbhB/YbcL family protein
MVLSIVVGSAGVSAAPQASGPMPPVTIQQVEAKDPAHLRVTSNSFKPNGSIPEAFSGYGKNEVPSLNWSKGPGDTKSYAVVIEDPAAHQPKPVVHFVAYDIPPSATMLPLHDLHMGKNSKGTAAYAGPHPPAGDAPHPYHFQVFALDRTLDLPDGASLDDVVSAMSGHVLADGEVIGTYQAKMH